MIGVIGIKRNIEVDIRGKLSITPKRQNEYIEKLLEVFKEVVILSTCNRMEIYFNNSKNLKDEEIFNKVFEVFGWDMELKQYVFLSRNKEAVRHLMEVVCGFHSRILGEDQILGQVKTAYLASIETRAVTNELQRLFQDAISCGKKFRTESKMFEIPVSSASISVNKGLEKGAKDFMVLGYGEIGKLVVKHILSHKVENLYIVVRNKASVDDLEDSRVKVLDYNEKNEFINNVGCVISCTSAPHEVIKLIDLEDAGEEIVIFDLAVPRDVEKSVKDLSRVTLYDIDLISVIDDENKVIRETRMLDFRYIVSEAIEEYINWCSLRSISPHIIRIKEYGDNIVQDRINTFTRKNKTNNEKLVKTLIKSASDAYINRAIEVLKEERLRGCEEECVRILTKVFNLK